MVGKSPVFTEFINEVVKNKLVYALKNNEGYAMSISNYFVTDEDEMIHLFCFWSKKLEAEKCLVEEWGEYQVEKIPLATFMEDWCIGTSNENYGLGINFDTEANGLEVDPLELLLAISEKLIQENNEIKFKKFKSVKEIKHLAKQAISYEN